MLSYDEAARIAARKLGVEQVVTNHLVDWGGTLLCFVEDREISLREVVESRYKYIGDCFCFVDAATGIAINYDLRNDWARDAMEACANFTNGLQSQFYHLEIFDVRDWERTRQLLQAMRLHTSNLVAPTIDIEDATDWLSMDLSSLESELKQRGKLVFHADINGYYEFLYAGRYYQIFGYALFAYNRETATVGAEISPDDESYLNECDERDENEEVEDFWEFLDERPIVAAKGIDSIG